MNKYNNERQDSAEICCTSATPYSLDDCYQIMDIQVIFSDLYYMSNFICIFHSHDINLYLQFQSIQLIFNQSVNEANLKKMKLTFITL